MRLKILSLFILLSTLSSFSQNQKNLESISYVKLDFKHSSRIPYNTVVVEIFKKHSKIILNLTSKTSKTKDNKWAYSNKSKTYEITPEDYIMLLQKVTKIDYSDIAMYFDYFTLDGYTTSITYGGNWNNVSYTLGGPFKQDEAGSLDYFNACRYILKLAELNPKEIL